MLTYIIIFVSLYLIFSILEWIIHKYIMHNDSNSIGKNHLIHHKSTTANMTLNKDNNEYKELSSNENLCFDKEIIIAAVIFYIIYLYVLKSITKNRLHLIFSFIVFIILITFIFIGWNSVHAYIHHEDGKDKCKYALSYETVKKLHEKNNYIDLLVNNHIMHHKRKGNRKGNFCVTLIGADHLFGTYYVKE